MAGGGELLIQRLEAVNDWLGRTVSWLGLGMVLVTFLVVLLRKAFDLGWIGLQESVTYMHALLFMLGAAYTLRHDGHVRVDILYHRFDVRGKAAVDLFGALLLLIPSAIYIGFASWDYVGAAWAVREGSREAGGLPWLYLLKTLLLIMPATLLLQGAVMVLRALTQLLRGDAHE